ncbi:PAS domain S-box [Rivularia sp. PCC 7116]|uniref:PAS domain-containing protein n=1 Tax=Rivularia sp. PCC 7116 TaxID=373994 RepID=UPI00029ED319|nr:PAS domain-containing protein [Rivularia sp. PCC 7116]AFY57221.1 PAS domain S-box [Rivularia sp. PCC 7116]
MCWKNLLHRLANTYKNITKTNENESTIHYEYIQELSNNLEASFQMLKQTNDERDKLSDRKTAKLQILDDELFLDIHSSGSILMVVSENTEEIINVNDSFFHTLEYSRQDIIGKNCSKSNIWVNNQDPIIIKSLLQEAKRIKQQIFQFRTKSGRIKDFLLSAEVIVINGENVVFYMASDITNMTHNSCMSYRCLNDPDYTMKYVSYGCEKITGYNISDIVSNQISYASIIYKDDEQYVWKSIQNALEKKKAYEILYRIKTQSGEIKWMWEKGQGIFYNNMESLALEGLIEDVNELKESEDKLFQIRNDLRKQIQQIVEELQETNSILKSAQEIPVLLEALNVANIEDIAQLTKFVQPEKIAANLQPELHLPIINLGKVALTVKLHQTIAESHVQEKIFMTAKQELQTVMQQLDSLPTSLQLLISQIIKRWELILNNQQIPSEDV